MKNRPTKSKILRSYSVATISIALVLFLLGSISYAMISIFRSAQGVREGVVMLVEIERSILLFVGLFFILFSPIIY